MLAGCASAPPKPTAEALAPVECGARASSGDAVARLGRALGYGAVGVLVGAFQGAGDGASWVLVTGGSWSEAAWIEAAAGAGLGFLIRFVTGLAKAGSGFGAEPAAPPRCPSAVAEPTAHAEDYIETEHTN